MKRVLLDHCVPRRVAKAFTDCEVRTAFRQGWAGLKNGALLRAAEDAGFDVFLSSDKNLQHQQNLSRLRIAIVILPTNALHRLIPIFPKIADAVAAASPTSYVEVAE